MVRVFLKGGVWKNSEDEILKAAVMKYGKHQWARVASLLNRKSAKQCKARWHEWLDPSVRKVEWSRAEEEKLLHLAKLMPAQWKTIAPLVGRTAAQCQEHYEQLLDEAATGGGKSEGDGPEGASLRSSQQLRPGQIDSHPETKPARPDPIDMDEDEIEMLQEARARLANTQGKKAKRKQREKMLNEAKRLAELQKRRELKQAGLLSSAALKKSKKHRKEIDLGVEIPFHKPAPAGFHDVSAEDNRAETIRAKRLKSVDFQQVNEAQYRTRDREAAQRQKKEEARLRQLERSNMQYAVAQVSKQNDPLAKRKRGVLELPAPTVSDTELSQLAKMQAKQQEDGVADGDGVGTGVTQALMGDYSNRPLPTPMRTPMTQQQTTQESLLREAGQLRRLEQGKTPLLGIDGEAHGEDDVEDGFEKAGEEAVALAAATPRLAAGGASATPMTVLPRDELGLNAASSLKRPYSELRGDDASVGASTFATSTMSIREMAREERRAAKKARRELEAALAALPAPQFEYELAAPQDMDIDEDEGPKVENLFEKDAADLEAEERARMQKEAEKLYEARSSVVKRSELPRPAGAIPDNAMALSENLAERLIQEEMMTLLRHDAHAFPVFPGGTNDTDKKKKKRKKVDTALPPEMPLEYLPEEALDGARDLLLAETEALYNEKVAAALSREGTQGVDEAERVLMEANQAVSKSGIGDLLYTATEGWISTTDHSKAVQSMKTEFEALQEATVSLKKRNEKLEAKLSVKHGGYAKRAESIRQSAVQGFAERRNAEIETAVFSNLQSHEDRGSEMRIEKLQGEIAKLKEDETVSQKRYGDLLLEKKRLAVKLAK
jgi:pre-mRNA-splicing factor CDC5/CEF1